MRSLPLLTALSAGLITMALNRGALAAEPGLMMRVGHFPSAHVPPHTRATTAQIANAAREVVRAQAVPSSLVELADARTVELANGTRIVKLTQRHQGLPVLNRGASVTFGMDDVARVVAASVEEDLPSSVVPQIAAEVAAANAARVSGLPADSSRALLAIWSSSEGGRLVWAVAPTPIAGVPYVPAVIVDAESGEVVLTYNAARTLNEAKVYPSNPTKSPGLIDVTLAVGANQATLQNNLIKSLNCIDKKTKKTVFNFEVHSCELLQTVQADANGDFLVEPGGDKDPEDAFAEVSMFYHAMRAYDFFRTWDSDLKVDPGVFPTVSNLRLPAGIDTFDIQKMGDVNLPLEPFQNAFFAPANPIFEAVFDQKGGAMWFGQGPKRDYSYDGDVVYHEFTHAVVNVTLKLVGTPHMDEFGTSYSPGAMNEGLADYFSSALTGDGDVGEYAAQDFAEGAPAIRSLDAKDSCPTAIAGEVHQDATLFSGALWDVRKVLSPEQQIEFDGAVFEAMNMSPTGNLGYEDFAKLVLAAVEKLPKVSDALTNAFTARGVLPKCSRVLEFSGQQMDGPLQGLWFAPGTQTTGAGNKDAAEGYTPGVVQFHAKLPAGATKLAIDFDQVNVSAGGFGGMGTPFAPKLLVRFGDAPITFSYKPFKAADGVVVVTPEKSGSSYATTVDVPAGTTSAYVMVASAGQSDGAYTSFALSADTGAIGTGTGGGGAGVGGGSGGSGGDGTKAQDEPQEIGGCGCAMPGTSGAGGSLAGLAIAALAIAARRRRG